MAVSIRTSLLIGAVALAAVALRAFAEAPPVSNSTDETSSGEDQRVHPRADESRQRDPAHNHGALSQTITPNTVRPIST
jgi:hypothetical protein